jgi:hypothetical protein
LLPLKVIIFHVSRIADAEENLGEVEVREAHIAKSLYFIRVGEKVLGGKSHNQDTSELVTLV